MTRATVVTAVLWAASLVVAVEPASQPAGPAEAQAAAVAPFIDPLTIGVIRIDMTGLDPDAVVQQGLKWIALFASPREQKRAADQWAKEKPDIDRALAMFRKAGGREVYVVVTLADLLTSAQPFAVVPLVEGADAETLGHVTRSLHEGRPVDSRPAGTRPTTASQPTPSSRPALASRPYAIDWARMHGAVVVGPAPVLKRLQAMETPAQRPEVAAALAAIDGHVVQAVLVPSQDVRAVVEALLPMPGSDLERLGIKGSVFTRGIVWGALGVNPPPKTSAKGVIQSVDGPAAQVLHDTLVNLVPVAIEEARFTYALTTQGTQGAESQTQAVSRLLLGLVPQVQGDRLVETLTSEQADQIVTQAAPILAKARERAKKMYSANNIGQFGRAVHIYYAQKNAWPDDFRQMIQVAMRMKYDESMDLLHNPQRPDMKPAYIYVKPGLPMNRMERPGDMVVVYEAYDTWGDGINVGILDGHVTFVRDQAEFEKMLARTKAVYEAAATQPAPASQTAGSK